MYDACYSQFLTNTLVRRGDLIALMDLLQGEIVTAAVATVAAAAFDAAAADDLMCIFNIM